MNEQTPTEEQSQQHIASVLPFALELPPLREDDGGAVRVGTTRITLDLIVEEYEDGMTPEEIVAAYDTLNLADVYGVIGYYLRNRAAVQAYLERREKEAAELQATIEAERPRISREELLTRRQAREANHAPTGQ